MRFSSFLHQTLGFTRNEIKVILFLAATFLGGLAVRWYQSSDIFHEAEEFDYSAQDSEFIEKSQVLLRQDQDSANEERGTEKKGRKKPKPLLPASIDINTATVEDLVLLPGIGNTYGERIVEYRKENGPFRSVDDLQHVKGIGRKTVEKIRKYLTVGPPGK